ncbi:MAG: DnaB-like helicase C-terminal domain-containing protein [Candidatus Woesearchaeota archaeon]
MNRQSDAIEGGLFDKIKPEMFYTEKFKKAFTVLRELYLGSEESSVDEETFACLDEEMLLVEQAKDKNFRDIWIPAHSEYIDRLKQELHKEWKTVAVSKKLNESHQQLFDEDGDYRKPLEELSTIEDTFTKKETGLPDILCELSEEAKTGRKKGFRTGIEGIDKTTERLKKGHLWVIGGYTGRGKTTLALQIAISALKEIGRIDYITLEMTAKQLMDRLVWLNRCVNGVGFDDSINEISRFPIVVTEGLFSTRDIEAHINSKSKQVDVFVVDFLQNVTGGEREYDRINDAIRTFQKLALSCNVCILVLSQISNEGVRNESDVMAFKGSGTIGACADVAIEIRRDKKRDVIEVCSGIRIEVCKNRHGRTGGVDCIFDTEKGYFKEFKEPKR